MDNFFLFMMAVGALLRATGSVEPVHNVHISLLPGNKTAVKVNFDKPAKVANDLIDKYVVEIRQTFHEMLDVRRVMSRPPQTHLLVAGLVPKVLYDLRVSVFMKDKNMTMSAIQRFTTEQANASNWCLCDPFGSYNLTRNDSCQPNTLRCRCRPHYTGSHCSICGPGHYRKMFQGCERCPCYTKTSSGSCLYDARIHRTRCIGCKEHGAGPLCEICVPGFYRKDPLNGKCLPCSCLTVPGHTARCRMVTGECVDCPNGTAGRRCESCMAGWSGAAPHCVPGASLLHSSVTVVTALVALLCVAAALLLGYWAMRVRARRKRLNLWSLELNRYELEAPGGLVDSASHSGLMMEEAPPPTSSRLQLRQAEPPSAGAEEKPSQLV